MRLVRQPRRVTRISVIVNDNFSTISDVVIVTLLLWQRVNSRHSGSGFVTYRRDGPRILSWRFTGELAKYGVKI